MNEKPSSPQKRKGWDERYATEDYLFGTEPNDFLKSVAEKDTSIIQRVVSCRW